MDAPLYFILYIHKTDYFVVSLNRKNITLIDIDFCKTPLNEIYY